MTVGVRNQLQEAALASPSALSTLADEFHDSSGREATALHKEAASPMGGRVAVKFHDSWMMVSTLA